MKKNKSTQYSEFLFACRINANMSQLELAQKLGYSSGQFVSNIERGTVGLPLKKIKKFCRALKLKDKDIDLLRGIMIQEYSDKIDKVFDSLLV